MLDTFDECAERALASLEATVRDGWPQAMVQRSRGEHDNRTIRALSVLHEPAGDAVEVELELRWVQGRPRCEATLYVGQDTAMNLWSEYWSSGSDMLAELRRTLEEFSALIARRTTSALQATAGERRG